MTTKELYDALIASIKKDLKEGNASVKGYEERNDWYYLTIGGLDITYSSISKALLPTPVFIEEDNIKGYIKTLEEDKKAAHIAMLKEQLAKLEATA